MSKRPIIIDCDPGTDDAINLFLAFASPEEFDILAVTTVAGNVPLERTEKNARIIRQLSKREDVPVFAGCPRPLMREPVFADEIHGDTGMDGMTLFEPSKPAEDKHAVDVIRETLLDAEDDSITLVVTGPFTNIAVAIVQAPAILPKIKEIVVMGGARQEAGNVSASAEYNIGADPHAAHVVFTCGRPVIALGLDVTHQALALPDRIARIAALGTPAAEAAAGMLTYVSAIEYQMKKFAGTPVHDPCTIAYLLRPDLFETKPCHIAVETGSPLTMGHTSVDFWNTRGEAPNALWVHGVDAEGLFDLITERIARL